MSFFSEREEGEQPRDGELIAETAWGGLQAVVRARIEDGSFGACFPDTCPDGHGPIGTDENSFWQAMHAEIPSLKERPWYPSSNGPPRTLDVLDMLEFCWRNVGKPARRDYHIFFSHYHLSFDIDAGRAELVEAVNRIFRRNSLVYQLTNTGQVERLTPPFLREVLTSTWFRTTDSELNRMLATAQRKFLDPDEEVRRESLEVLWDAWERLKTFGSGSNKKVQTIGLLDTAAGQSSSKFREVLERESRELTWIGNNLMIRHSEVTQERLAECSHVDYLFHRLFGMILLILRGNNRG